MPVWRFVLSPGLITAGAWVGVMAPSVDSVGRYFPLTLASALPVSPLDGVATLFAARPWFEALAHIALSAIAAEIDLVMLDTALATRPFRDEWLRCADHRGEESVAPAGVACFEPAERPGADPRALWFAEASDIFGRALLVCDELPPGTPFCAMIDGRWEEHGWTRREKP